MKNQALDVLVAYHCPPQDADEDIAVLLDEDGYLDLSDKEVSIRMEAWSGDRKIGSYSKKDMIKISRNVYLLALPENILKEGALTIKTSIGLSYRIIIETQKNILYV